MKRSFNPHREDCIKHLECGILFPVDEIPEDYLNLSIVYQLRHYLGEKYCVTTQTADEGRVLPYNCYFKSRPDIVNICTIRQ